MTYKFISSSELSKIITALHNFIDYTEKSGNINRWRKDYIQELNNIDFYDFAIVGDESMNEMKEITDKLFEIRETFKTVDESDYTVLEVIEYMNGDNDDNIIKQDMKDRDEREKEAIQKYGYVFKLYEEGKFRESLEELKRIDKSKDY